TPVRYLHRRSVRGLIAPTPRQYQHRPWAPLIAWTPVRYRRHRLPPSIAQTLGRYPHRRSAPRRWTESRPVPSQLPRWGPRWNRRNRVPCPLRQLALLSSQLNPQPCRPPPLVPLRWTGSKPGRCLPPRSVLPRWTGPRPGGCRQRRMRQSVELIRHWSRLPQRSRLLQRLLPLSNQSSPALCLRLRSVPPSRQWNPQPCLPHRSVPPQWTEPRPGRCRQRRMRRSAELIRQRSRLPSPLRPSNPRNRERCPRRRLVLPWTALSREQCPQRRLVPPWTGLSLGPCLPHRLAPPSMRPNRVQFRPPRLELTRTSA